MQEQTPGEEAHKASASAAATNGRAGETDSTFQLIRRDGRSVEVMRFESSVVSFFLEAAEVLGVPKSVAAIYGICFASVEPLSFVDINSRLDISQGSISQGLRVLREVGALRVVGAHDRREYFAPDLELRRLVTHFIEARLEKQLKAGRGRLQLMRAAIPEEGRDREKELKARLKYLQTWHEKGRALVPLVKAYLKLA